jgi:hypothetical protein
MLVKTCKDHGPLFCRKCIREYIYNEELKRFSNDYNNIGSANMATIQNQYLFFNHFDNCVNCPIRCKNKLYKSVHVDYGCSINFNNFV